jgi:DNA polymerase-3 subunit beta
MKVTIDQKKGAEALSIVSKAVASKDIVPIAAGIKIEASAGKLSFEATDLERTIVNTINEADDVKIQEDGQCVIPGKYFTEFFRRLPDGEIGIETDGANALLRYGLNETTINGYPAEEFPERNSIEAGTDIKVKATDLREALNKVIYAADSKNKRPILNSVLFEFIKNGIAFVSSDSHRLAWTLIAVPGIKPGTQLVLPGKMINDFLKTSVPLDAEVQICSTENTASLKVDNLCFITRLIEDKFPNYKAVIPKSDSINLSYKANVAQIKGAVERASISKNGTNTVKIVHKHDTIEINSENESGKINEIVPISESSGESYHIAFNGKYLVEALNAIETEEVFFRFSGARSPALLLPFEEQKRSINLVLPIRIKEQ